MPFARFLLNDFISCSIWALILAGTGYFFSGAVTSIIGDFQQIGIALFVIVVIGIVGFYLLETLWLSKKVEDADLETIQKIEEKIHDIEDRFHIPHRHDEKVEKELQRREDGIKDDEQNS